MNKKQKIVLGLGAMTLVLGASGGLISSAQAYQGNPAITGPNYSIERHEAMEKAFETKDYTAWKNLMVGNGNVTEVVNQDNFAKFVEAQELAKEGDLVGAKEIRRELGLGLGNGSGNRNNNASRGSGRGNYMNK